MLERVWRASVAHWVWAIVAIGVLLYLPGLDQRTIYAEEGRRAFQAVNILHGGSWWLLDIGGERYIAKPPLLPWLIALTSYVTGGLNEWAVRLPSVAFTVVSALATGGIARLLVTQRTGVASGTAAPGFNTGNLAAFAGGICFLTCPSIIERARIGETDLAATAGVAVAFWIFAAAWSRGRLGIWAWLGVAAALAVAAFAKGPIPLAFGALPILVATSTDRPRGQLPFAVAAIVLSQVPLGAWAFLNYHGAETLIWLNEARLNTSAAVPRDWLAMLHLNQVPRWLVGMLPWVLLAGLHVWRERRGVRSNGLLRALLLYAIPISVVVLAWPGGRGRYALPAIVPVMALAAAAVALYWQERPVRRTFVIGGTALAIGAIVFATALTGRSDAQVQRRADIAALRDIVGNRPRGALLAIAPDFNLLIYAQRPIRIVSAAEIGCGSPDDTLVAPQAPNIPQATNGAWRLLGAIGSSGHAAYAAAEGRGGCL